MKKETIERIRKFSEDRDWDQFHSPANLAKSISIEANELLECFQWDENNFDINKIKEELADVLVYCRNMLDKLDLDEDEIVNAKMEQNEKKYPIDKAKGTSTKYDKLDEVPTEEDTNLERSISPKPEKTYYCIMCEMNGFSYKADDSLKALAKEIKKYVLEVLNSQVKTGKLNDPIFACSIKTFFGHHLAWNKASWKTSAAVVYNYFKSKTLISSIKEYEKIFNKEIVHNYFELLEFFYQSLSAGKEIEYWRAPGIGSAFSYVPEETLNNKLKQFKDLYE